MTIRTNNYSVFLFVLFFCSSFCFSQDESKEVFQDSAVKDNAATISKNRKHKLLSLSAEVYLPVPTGSNFAGDALKGKTSHNVKAQLFVYKGFFAAATGGQSFFDNDNPAVTGNYSKTQVESEYYSLGYEFYLSSKMRLGLAIGVYGESRYRNTGFTEGHRSVQTDHGKIRVYELYFDYQLSNTFAVYANYSYRSDRMDIKAPSEIQSFFDKANYHNFGIGIKINIGSKDLFSLVTK